MKKQTIETLVFTHNGISKVLRTDPIFLPKVSYSGKEMNWYQDKLKQ